MSLLDTASLIVTPNGYKEGTLYSVIPSDGSGDMSVTRATTATRVNSAGVVESVANNIPRLDYSNGTCPSLLVEPQRTNLLTYSSSFDNAVWNKQNCTITANTLNSPSGVQDSDSLIASSGTLSAVGLFLSESTSAPKNFSFFAKKGNKDWAVLLGYNGNNNVWFNVSNGTIGTIGSNFVNAQIEDFGNGWYRCSATLNSSVAILPNIGLYVSNSDNSLSCTGDGTTTSIYLWGAQLEAGSYPTSYIPTTSASVTRNADVISKTGISSLIGQTEGTLFVEVYNYNNFTSTSSIPFSISNGAYGDAVYFEVYQNLWYASVFNGFNAQFQQTVGTLSTGYHKLAISYKANDFVFYVDGSLAASDTSGTVPSCSRVDIGTVGTSTTPEEMQVKAAALWKTRLSNTQLAQLTTI